MKDTNDNTKLNLLKIAWHKFAVEYHFNIPKDLLVRYWQKYWHERGNIKKYGFRYLNPEDAREYAAWRSYLPMIEYKNAFYDITFLSDQEIKNVDKYPILIQDVLDINKITTKYICIVDSGCCIYNFKFLDERYFKESDIVYFDYDFLKEDGTRINPQLLPDYSYDTLRGYNYIGNCWFVKTDVMRPFDKEAWNPYGWLLRLSDKRYTWEHVPQILYGTYSPERNQKDILNGYLQEAFPNSQIISNQDGITNRVQYSIEGSPLVSIVIPMRDGIEDTKKCISSIYEKTTYKNFEIIIADNGSQKLETKEYITQVKNMYTNIHVISIDIPFNYSRINNIAIRNKARGKFIVLLNNDTSVITENWLEQMVGYAQLKHVGSVGVKLLYPDTTLQHAGVIAGKSGVASHRYYRKDYAEKDYMHALSIPYDVACCTAACLMFRRSCFDEVGGLNEELAVNFNDVDFGFKLLDRGYHNIFLPSVELFHYESKSRGLDITKEKLIRYRREVKYMQEKWSVYLKHDPYYSNLFDKAYDYRLKLGVLKEDLDDSSEK